MIRDRRRFILAKFSDSLKDVDSRLEIHYGYANDGKIYFDFPTTFNINNHVFNP